MLCNLSCPSQVECCLRGFLVHWMDQGRFYLVWLFRLFAFYMFSLHTKEKIDWSTPHPSIYWVTSCWYESFYCILFLSLVCWSSFFLISLFIRQTKRTQMLCSFCFPFGFPAQFFFQIFSSNYWSSTLDYLHQMTYENNVMRHFCSVLLLFIFSYFLPEIIEFERLTENRKTNKSTNLFQQ